MQGNDGTHCYFSLADLLRKFPLTTFSKKKKKKNMTDLLADII
jgi:hypothetical protein